MVLFLRFRNPPDDQMKRIVDYIEAGKPIVALRTSTHAFQIPKDRKYAKYDWRFDGPEYKQGFGRQVLSETWFSHHGWHRYQATRGLIAPGAKNHPILRGIKDGSIFGPTDVYGVRLPLLGDSKPLVLGQVLSGMKEDDKPLPPGPHYRSKEPVNQNDPMMPIAWTKTHKGGRVFVSTIGASLDMLNEGVRRLLVNGCYWATGLDKEIPGKSNVDIVGEFNPTMFEFIRTKNYWPDKGMKPADFELSLQ